MYEMFVFGEDDRGNMGCCGVKKKVKTLAELPLWARKNVFIRYIHE
jgi:hypothetical protein